MPSQIVRFDADAFAGVDHRLQFLGCAKRQIAAVVHNENTVADLFDLFHVVAGVDHRRAFAVKPLDAFENRIATLWVHGHGRFVEKDQIWFVRDAAGDVEPSQQTAGQLRRPISSVIVQIHKVQRLGHQFTAVCPIRRI